MEQFDKITDGLLYFVPAFLVMIVLFWMMKKNADRDQQLRVLDLRKHLQKETIQLRLQAYERLLLFLERISPNSILPRLHRSGMTASQLQTELIVTIRTEFEHNYSQQLYISNPAWEEVKDAKEQMIRVITNAMKETGDKGNAMQLSSRIFEHIVSTETMPNQKAIDYLKKEARQLFG